MAKLEKIEEKLENVNMLANEVARRSNNEVSVLKHKITCLTVLVVLFAILGACIALYSIHSMKELFYDMEIEETTHQEIEANDSENVIGIMGDNNEVYNGKDKAK